VVRKSEMSLRRKSESRMNTNGNCRISIGLVPLLHSEDSRRLLDMWRFRVWNWASRSQLRPCFEALEMGIACPAEALERS
jgi:hypothetical protein